MVRQSIQNKQISSVMLTYCMAATNNFDVPYSQIKQRRKIVSAPNVDLVLVIDTSLSMEPCIQALREHLKAVIKPLQGYANTIRFGLVTISVSKSENNAELYRLKSVVNDVDPLDVIYLNVQQNSQVNLFSHEPDELISALNNLTPFGDERMLFALDVALDMPFGPLANTKRVIAMFTDEPFETNIRGDEDNAMIPALIEKIQARHVQLFCAMPDGVGTQSLSEADRSEFELVQDGGGLADVDFGKMLQQMGRSISNSVLQMATTENYPKGLFGQGSFVETEETGQNLDFSKSQIGFRQ